jgi:hypothetical protein
MRVGLGCWYVDYHRDHRFFERNVPNPQSRNRRLDVMLEHLLKPDCGIDTSVYTVVESGWLVVLLGHSVDDLPTVCICKCTYVARHFELLGVVLLINGW